MQRDLERVCGKSLPPPPASNCTGAAVFLCIVSFAIPFRLCPPPKSNGTGGKFYVLDASDYKGLLREDWSWAVRTVPTRTVATRAVTMRAGV
jgi:hypothetical protein